jgi:hypothetical protein
METSPLENNCRQACFTYDFAKHGGAVGAITVYGDNIPKDAIILDGIIRVNTAVTATGSATVAIMAQGAGDILAALGKASFTLNAKLDVVPLCTAATCILLTAAIKSLTFTVAVDALLTGKVTVSLRWMLGG